MLNENDIVMQYKQAKYPCQQIKILADLYETSRIEIKKVLHKHCLIDKKTDRKVGSGKKADEEKRKAANELYNKNYTYRAISNNLEIPINTLYKWKSEGVLKKE